MKKNLLISLLIPILCLLGCVGEQRYAISQSYEQIQQIELIDVSFQYYPPSEDALCQKEATLAIDSKYWRDFFSAFQEVECLSYWNDPTYQLSGTVIRILYKNGLYEFIGTDAVLLQKENGSWYYSNCHFNGDDFQMFIQKVTLRR